MQFIIAVFCHMVSAAFICLAAIRYYRQHSGARVEEVVVEEEQEPQEQEEEGEEKQKNDQKELIAIGSESHK